MHPSSPRLFLLIAIVLLSSAAFAPGSHCRYFEIKTSPSMTITFAPEFKNVASGNEKLVFAVPEGAVLKLTGISTYIAHCVDGASREIQMPFRVVKINGLGNEEEWMKGYELTGAEACEGGNATYGISGDLESLPFNQAGTYDFRIEYTEKINASPTRPEDWLKYKDIQVIVVPGQISISPAKGTTIGLEKSVWGTENSKKVSFFWEIKNESNVDIKLDSVAPTDGFCSTGGTQSYLKECAFPDFSPGLELGRDATYLLKMDAAAERPQSSPASDRLSLNVVYSDKYGVKTEDSRKKIEPVNVDVRYTVNATAIAPFTKTGNFQVEPGKTYYAQFCNDSPATAAYDVPVHFFEIYDDSGNLVASRSFHTVANPNESGRCTDSGTLSFYNYSHDSSDPEAALLAQFTVPGAADPEGKAFKNYRWKLEGIVGVNDPDIGNNYRSDFFRIGKSFNAASSKVEGLIVDTSFGAQHYAKSASPEQAATLDIFSGTKELGSFSPELPAGETYGQLFFTIGAATFTNSLTGTFTSTSPGQRIASPDTEIFTIQENTPLAGGGMKKVAHIYGRTSVRKVTTDKPPIVDIKLAWLDKEKYLLEIKAGAAGVCRDLDGSVISSGSSSAFTGKDVKPKVKYEWRPQMIAENFCSDDAAGGYTVCDSTQFSIMLLKKLNVINDLIGQGKIPEANAKLSFAAYLMRDGFSPDFRDDFDAFMHDKFFDSQAQAMKYYNVGEVKQMSWDKYFRNPAEGLPDRLMFITGEPVLQPGQYQVTISFDWDDSKLQKLFDDEGNPSAKISVRLVRVPGKDLPANLLYYLPIDAHLGRTNGMLDRVGYGVGFVPKTPSDQVPFFVLNDKHDFDVYTLPMAENSAPLAKIYVERKTGFSTLSKNEPGRLLSISRKEGSPPALPEYSMSFAASLPVPLIFKAEHDGKKIAMGYLVRDNSGSVDAGQSLARLVEIAELRGSAAVCKDSQTNKSLPAPIGTDTQLAVHSGPKCTLLQGIENTSVVYVFGRESTSESDIALETVLYAPSKGSQIRIRNVCATQGAIYVPTFNEKGIVNGTRQIRGTDTEMVLDNPGQALWTVAEAIEKIGTSEACIAYGTTMEGIARSPVNVGVYWNEQELLSLFRDKVSKLSSGGFHADACFSN